ncbi:MAG: precorrin-3B C(17)-methyltransferase, partial [bacterium]|nr:precorrin-3B C(17)-methyltransferase [bacterium]
ALVAARLTIARNHSVSERLWRLVTHDGATRAQWLVEVPAHVWEIVRDNVLRCS